MRALQNLVAAKRFENVVTKNHFEAGAGRQGRRESAHAVDDSVADREFGIEFIDRYRVDPITLRETVGVKKRSIDVSESRVYREFLKERLLPADVEARAAILIHPLVTLEQQRVRQVYFLRLDLHSFVQKITSHFEGIVCRKRNAFVELFTDEELVVIDIVYMLDTAKKARPGQLTDASEGDRYLVEINFFGIAKLHASAGDVGIVIVRGDLRILAVVERKPAYLKLAATSSAWH